MNSAGILLRSSEFLKHFLAERNQGAKYHLAIVLVSEDDSIDGPHYVSHPFKEEPGWGVSSVNYDLKALLARACPPQP